MFFPRIIEFTKFFKIIIRTIRLQFDIRNVLIIIEKSINFIILNLTVEVSSGSSSGVNANEDFLCPNLPDVLVPPEIVCKKLDINNSLSLYNS